MPANLRDELGKLIETWLNKLAAYDGGANVLSCDEAGQMSACLDEVDALLSSSSAERTEGVSAADVCLGRPFSLGDRVQLSPLGIARRIAPRRMRQEDFVAVVVGFSRDLKCVWVVRDGAKTPQRIKASFLMPLSSAYSQVFQEPTA